MNLSLSSGKKTVSHSEYYWYVLTQLLAGLPKRWTVNEVSDMTAVGQQRAIEGKQTQDFQTSLMCETM